ncbi:MAG: hypothetical protein JXR76_32675 [Deltaproteobacteria bacterium]|nr:hypothetical protein [Deltaproteobacteria bacterium]
MFWKLIEFIVRIIFWRRFRTAKKIGEAATLLSDGKPNKALTHLEKYGNAVHQSLIPLFALTQGKIYEALGRLEDAENSFKAVVLTNPKDARADVALAVLTGRQGRFDDCRTWLNRAIEKEHDDVSPKARELLSHLDAIEDGSKQQEYENRARALAEKTIVDGKQPGLEPPNTALLAQWVTQPDAKDSLDDVALLLAYAELKHGGHWKIGLAIEDTAIIRADGSEYRPFDTLNEWLSPTPGAK